MLTRIGSPADIPGILSLQENNLYENLSGIERKLGFVTTPFSDGQLLDLLAQRGVFVAEEKGKIAGYALAADWDFFAQWPIFPYMASRLSTLTFLGDAVHPVKSFQYGPVCIEPSLRGTGLFPRLFEEMRLEFSSRFPVGITFINRINERSYAAHTRKLGMTVIDEFEFNGRNYYGLAFDTSRSVIDK